MNRKNDEPLNPNLQSDSEILRTDRLRQRYGSDSEPWDKEFGGLDNSAEKARAAALRMRDYLAQQGIDERRRMRFQISIAGKAVTIQVSRDDSGKFFCHVPIEIALGRYEYRRLEAGGYDALIGAINRALRSRPTARELTPEESLELARACTTGRDLDVVLWRYLELRLGKGVNETTLHDPKFVPVTNDAVLFILAHSDPTFPNTPQCIEYIKRFAAGRPLTLPMAKAAFSDYQKQSKIGPSQTEAPAPPEVTEAELEAATDEELRESMRSLAIARAEQDRKRRELIYGRQ